MITKLYLPQSTQDRSTYYISNQEMEKITQLQEIVMERERIKLEDDESLSIKCLLDDIDCTPRIKKLVMVNANIFFYLHFFSDKIIFVLNLVT